MRAAMVLVIAASLGGCGDEGESPADAAPRPDAPVTPAAHVVAMPPSVEFGTVGVYRRSPPQRITFVNTGGETATGAGVVIVTSNPGAFEVMATTCTNVALSPGASCTVDLTAIGLGSIFSTNTGDLHLGDAVAQLSETTGNAPPPLVLSPQGTQTFGTVQVGSTSAAKRWTFMNEGAVTISPLTVTSAGDTGDFAIDDACSGVSLGAGQTCHIDVTFSPTADGPRAQTMTVGAITGGMVVASMTGTGAAPTILTPTSHDFGDTRIGATSAPLTVTITNPSGSPLGSGALTRGGTNAGDFAITADTCTGVSLAPGASCTFDVSFAPTDRFMRTGSVTFVASPGGGAMIALSGTGISGPAQLAIASGSLAFGNVIVGATSAVRTLTLVNNGTVTTGALAVAKSGANAVEFDVRADTCTNATLRNGDTCHLDVTFTPGAPAGAKTATLTVSATPGGSVMAPMTGSSPSGGFIAINPSSLDFTRVTVGATATRSVTLSNQGAVTATAISVTRSGGAAFTSTTTCSTLAPGDSCTIDITFAPTTTGAQQATFTLGASPGGGAQIVAAGSGG